MLTISPEEAERLDAPRSSRSLKQAVPTALILLALIIIFSALGPGGFLVLALVVVLVAVFELLDAVIQRGGRPPVPVALLAVLALMLVAYYRRPYLYGVVVWVTVAVAFMNALRPGRSPTPASDIAWLALAVAWIGGGGAAAVAILVLEPEGLHLLVTFVLITAVSDIGAYFAGTRFGRRRIAPSISPGKSWAGFVGGTVCALLAGAGAGALLERLTVGEGLGLAAVCALLAPVGDLSESLAKRELGIKDSGRLLPGHGGLLDRLDAILFCAPAAYLYLRLVAG